MARVMERPRFRANWRVDLPTSSDVALSGEVGHQLVSGRAIAAMAPHLDGGTRTADLLETLKDAVYPPEFFYVLMQGEAAGYLADAGTDGGTAREQLGFWDIFGADAGTRAAVDALRIGVIPLGAAAPEAIASALRADALTLTQPAEANFFVVVTDDLLAPGIAEFNASVQAAGTPWMLVRPIGLQPSVGPIFVPGETACWACLEHRLRGNREVADHIERTSGRSAGTLAPKIEAPGSAAMAGAITALEIARFMARADRALTSALLTFDPAGGGTTRHEVSRRPHCPVCGTAASGDWQAPELTTRPRDRAGGMDASLIRLRALVGPISGAIRSVDSASDTMDGLLHCYRTVHPFPMVRTDIRVLNENRFGRSGATAFTQEEAELGALGEAAERLSGVWIGEHEPRVRTTRTALGDAAIDIADCMLFSDRQMAAAGEWNTRATSARELVPAALDPDMELDWTPVWSLRDGHRRMLPAAYCYYGHPEAALGFCYSDSNGCAGGANREHAVLAGLLELVERDAVAIWWYNRLRRPAVDLDSFDLPFASALRTALARRDRDLTVLDLSHDLGIPVFAAVSARSGSESEEIMLGFGAGLDPRQGLMACLRELCQCHPMVSQRTAGGRTLYQAAAADTLRWLMEATRAGEPHLVPLDGPSRSIDDLPGLATSDLREDIGICLDRLNRAGIDAFVLDQTRPDIGIDVTRIVAPGLRHFWRRLGPGRLYDVPIQMGWCRTPNAEADLNPKPVFL